MNRFQAIAITCIAAALTVTASAAPPKVAFVRVKEIYGNLPATAALQEELKNDRAALEKSPIVEELRKVLKELQDIRAKLSDTANPPDENTKTELSRTFEMKGQAALALQKDFEVFRAEQEKNISTKVIKTMRASLDTISTASQKIAKEQDCDILFDTSGDTNTGLPFILYQKGGTTDITDAVKVALNATKAPTPPPAPAPTEAPATPEK